MKVCSASAAITVAASNRFSSMTSRLAVMVRTMNGSVTAICAISSVENVESRSIVLKYCSSAIPMTMAGRTRGDRKTPRRMFLPANGKPPRPGEPVTHQRQRSHNAQNRGADRGEGSKLQAENHRRDEAVELPDVRKPAQGQFLGRKLDQVGLAQRQAADDDKRPDQKDQDGDHHAPDQDLLRHIRWHDEQPSYFAG